MIAKQFMLLVWFSNVKKIACIPVYNEELKIKEISEKNKNVDMVNNDDKNIENSSEALSGRLPLRVIG